MGIVKCDNKECSKRYRCYRYCKRPDENQSYFTYKCSKRNENMLSMSCEICGKELSVAHHIVTKGAGGKDHVDNYFILCDEHHTRGKDAVHNIGVESFFTKFGFLDRLEKARELHRK